MCYYLSLYCNNEWKSWYHSYRDNQSSITVALSQKRASPRYHVFRSHDSRSRDTHGLQTRILPVARVDSCDQSQYTNLNSHLWEFKIRREFAIGQWNFTFLRCSLSIVNIISDARYPISRDASYLFTRGFVVSETHRSLHNV